MSDTRTQTASDEVWKTPVGDLVISFASAISGLIPHLRRVKIRIGVTVGVDAWEEITEVLYRHMVVEAIRWSLPPERMDSFKMPLYEMDYESYEDLSFLEVRPANHQASPPDQYFVFHSLKIPIAVGQPIDTVLARVVDRSWRHQQDALVEFPISSEFFCVVKCDEGRESRRTLEVRL